jgi:hypothetical protein
MDLRWHATCLLPGLTPGVRLRAAVGDGKPAPAGRLAPRSNDDDVITTEDRR